MRQVFRRHVPKLKKKETRCYQSDLFFHGAGKRAFRLVFLKLNPLSYSISFFFFHALGHSNWGT